VFHNYIVSQKVCHFMFINNFGKCGPIFKILSPIDLQQNSLCTHLKDFHIICSMLLHYHVKFENPKCCWFWQHRQQTADMFLSTFWVGLLDLTFNSSSTDCLKTDNTDWLLSYFEVCQTSSRCSVERCCIMVIFLPWLSSHHINCFNAILRIRHSTPCLFYS